MGEKVISLNKLQETAQKTPTVVLLKTVLSDSETVEALIAGQEIANRTHRSHSEKLASNSSKSE